MTAWRGIPVWLLCWGAAVAIAVISRPPLPVDETRYLAVAWEMWLRDDFIVPHLNGEPYHHKPPLLFWMMTAGWSIFGVNDWWPRLVAPLFALVALCWTGRLALQLWPHDEAGARLAPVLLVGAAFWAVFQTLTMFDMMLAACTLVGLGGIVRAWRYGGWGGWLITGLAIGVGVLAKGPAILLHILPVALLAPWWGPALAGAPDRPFVSWSAWYVRLSGAVLLGAGIALAWAVPAGIRGGEEYRDMIFWGQSAGRIVKSFDHARPFWWYLAVLPPLLLPWLIWPKLWRALRRHATPADGGVRLLISWVMPAFIVFSLISGKQLHYLLPEFAAFALLFARTLAMESGGGSVRKFDSTVIVFFFVLLGVAALVLSVNPGLVRKPLWFTEVHLWWGALLFISAFAVYRARKRTHVEFAVVVALSMGLLVISVHLSLRNALSAVYDLRPIAEALKSYEDKGHALANFGYYHGQYQFLGRLERPMAVLGLQRKTTEAFVENEDMGVVAAYYYVDELPAFPSDVEALNRFRFRDFYVYIWPVDAFRRYPRIGDRP